MRFPPGRNEAIRTGAVIGRLGHVEAGYVMHVPIPPMQSTPNDVFVQQGGGGKVNSAPFQRGRFWSSACRQYIGEGILFDRPKPYV